MKHGTLTIITGRTHSGGASQHSSSAPSQAASAFPSAQMHPRGMRPLAAASSPMRFLNRTASVPTHPHISTANGTFQKAE